MKQLLMTNWNWWRIARMLFAILFVVMGLLRADTILALGGGFLIFHALFSPCSNCVGGSCDINQTKDGKL